MKWSERADMLRLDPQSLQLRFSPPASHNYPYLHPTIIQPDSQSFNQIHNLSTEFVFFLCFLRAHCFFQSGLSDVRFTEKFSTLSIAYNFPVLYLIVFFNFSRMAISQTIWKTGKKWFLQKTRKALSCFGGNVEEEETYIPFERVDDDIACLTSAPIVEVVVESPADACPVQVPDVPFRFPVPQEVEQRSGKYQAQILVYTTYDRVRSKIEKHDEKLTIEAIPNLRGSHLHSELSAEIEKIAVYRNGKANSRTHHALVVFKTKKDWFSIERYSSHIRMYRSRNEKDVTGKDLRDTEWAIGKGAVIDIVQTLVSEENVLGQEFHFLARNCQCFAALIFSKFNSEGRRYKKYRQHKPPKDEQCQKPLPPVATDTFIVPDFEPSKFGSVRD